MNRHTLVDITSSGRLQAFQWIEEAHTKDDLVQIQELILNGCNNIKVPGIIRRQEQSSHSNSLSVGFSAPYFLNGNRVRVSAFIPENEITRFVTPYEIIQIPYLERTKVLQALIKIRELAELIGVELGVWGSTSLEIYTTLPYTHDHSDLDIIIKSKNPDQIEEFYFGAKEIGKLFDCKVDIELEIKDFAIKIVELVTNSSYILCKGIEEVTLLPRETVVQSIIGA